MADAIRWSATDTVFCLHVILSPINEYMAIRRIIVMPLVTVLLSKFYVMLIYFGPVGVS
jgi:hypothetical protein